MIRSSKVLIVQILRFVAASFVVVTHVDDRMAGTFSVDDKATVTTYIHKFFQLGGSGVDLFFIISGFIMIWVSFCKFGSVSSPLQFIKRRLIRIVPPYWAYTTLALAVLIFIPGAFSHGESLNWPWIAFSYLFIPAKSPGNIISPLVSQGWTLNYEMYFYIVFALILFFRIDIAIISIIIFFVLSSIIGSLYSFTFPLLIQNTSCILLEFIFGMCIGYFFVRGRWLIKSASYAFLVIGGSMFIFALMYDYSTIGLIGNWGRVLFWGIPLALIFSAIVSLFRNLPDNRLIKSLEIGGDASYSIYLFHPFAAAGFVYIAEFVGLNRFMPTEVLILPIAICSIIAGYIAYLVMEKPLTTYLHKKVIK
jgi:exopolysaccharide production protein ExoZ